MRTDGLRRGSSAAFLDARLDLALPQHISYITILIVPKTAVARDSEPQTDSEEGVRRKCQSGVPWPLRVDSASQQPGWAQMRQAQMGCQEAEIVCRALQYRPNGISSSCDINHVRPTGGLSKQPRKAGSAPHIGMHSRSGFRYRFAARWNDSASSWTVERPSNSLRLYCLPVRHHACRPRAIHSGRNNLIRPSRASRMAVVSNPA
jgi:hypothetical protein